MKPDYEARLDQLGPIGLFTYLTEAFIISIQNEKLAKLSWIIVGEQYINKTAGGNCLQRPVETIGGPGEDFYHNG